MGNVADGYAPPAGVQERLRKTVKPYVPMLVLNLDGSIRYLTAAARRMLEYHPEQPVASCFFSHVHPSHRHQVKRDLTDMACFGRKGATWLLRLRTGHRQWRWYRASVKNQPASDVGTIWLLLHDL